MPYAPLLIEHGQELILDKSIFGKQYTFVPFNFSKHWTILVILKTLNFDENFKIYDNVSKIVFAFDSFGLFDPRNSIIIEKISACCSLSDYNLVINDKKLQYDGWSCGIQCLIVIFNPFFVNLISKGLPENDYRSRNKMDRNPND